MADQVAEVLAEVLAEVERVLPPGRAGPSQHWSGLISRARDVLTATGARAAGGESADPHGGYTCAEIEAFSDNAMGDINAVSEVLGRRGHKVDLREHSIDHWVIEALKRAAAPPAPAAPGVAALLAENANLRGWNAHLNRGLAVIAAEDDQRPSDVALTQVLDAIIQTWPAPAEPAPPEHDTESDDGGNEG